MANFKITFMDGTTEEVTAERYNDSPPWIDFVRWDDRQQFEETVTRVRADDVDRIDRLS